MDNKITSLDFRKNENLRLVVSYGNPIESVQLIEKQVINVNDYDQPEPLTAKDWGVRKNPPVITIDVSEDAVGKKLSMNITLASVNDKLINDFGSGLRKSYRPVDADNTTVKVEGEVEGRKIRIYAADTAVLAIEAESDYIRAIDTSRCKNMKEL
ncbi:hypothetical protein [Dysgonomonas sp. ZJ279]|uniref:hypothetical protein n=1 Tax=Dysgonomonas sp. ZJ279 TaxID=2709796 RepID=UPI0013EC5ACC|nr:hypothetical protein [Dysgonomonas sp. ZJ279]